jgi:DNA-directed RNA polymerase subunit L
MQVKVLKKTSDELRIEIEGESHTLCNLLEKVLLEDESIDMAAYNIPHPLISNPIIYIRTKGRRNPETALRDAAKKILRTEKNFRASFDKALQNWEKEQKS